MPHTSNGAVNYNACTNRWEEERPFSNGRDATINGPSAWRIRVVTTHQYSSEKQIDKEIGNNIRFSKWSDNYSRYLLHLQNTMVARSWDAILAKSPKTIPSYIFQHRFLSFFRQWGARSRRGVHHVLLFRTRRPPLLLPAVPAEVPPRPRHQPQRLWSKEAFR